MAGAGTTIGVVVERRQGVTGWADVLWLPVAVLPPCVRPLTARVAGAWK